ncbi:MAG: RluA family pseudouridine synthase [Ruminococcaceae bacterium]|nr:RluA family pseudouridine synthase [Oscillospiraceae bacterium]
MDKITLVCEESGTRIDKYISVDGMTRATVQRLIENGGITVNGKPTKNNYKLKSGDIIEIEPEEPQDANIEAENIELDIVYEDDSLLVVNKPQGMVVHPAPGNYSGTLVNALMYHCKDNLSGINGVMRPGIVHRIDKDTSGLLLVAKTDEAHHSLSEQIQNKTVRREYICVCEGVVKPKKGIVDAPIGRDPSNRLKMAVTPLNSKNALTHFEVVEQFESAALVKCVLETGRTHQIRVHMQYIGHPVMGDPLYARSNPMNLSGQALHARIIGFNHPVTGEYMEFNVNPPEEFNGLVSKLQN